MVAADCSGTQCTDSNQAAEFVKTDIADFNRGVSESRGITAGRTFFPTMG